MQPRRNREGEPDPPSDPDFPGHRRPMGSSRTLRGCEPWPDLVVPKNLPPRSGLILKSLPCPSPAAQLGRRAPPSRSGPGLSGAGCDRNSRNPRRCGRGDSLRAIARGTGSDRKTIAKYVAAAQAPGYEPARPDRPMSSRRDPRHGHGGRRRRPEEGRGPGRGSARPDRRGARRRPAADQDLSASARAGRRRPV